MTSDNSHAPADLRPEDLARLRELQARRVAAQEACNIAVRDRMPVPANGVFMASMHFNDAVEKIAEELLDAAERGIARASAEPAATLDERLKAAGMFTVEQMMGVTPMSRWTVHAGVRDLDTFSDWLDLRVSEFIRMKAGYELGDKPRDDELYEWVLAHGAALSEVRENFRAARAAPVAAGLSREALRDHLLGEFGDAYDCTRVWEAWSVGTMTEDDFVPLSDRVEEITDAILAVMKAAPKAVAPSPDAAPLAIVYRNWRGETSTRRIIPLAAPRFGTSEWHKEPQWLLRALDVDKGEEREFAMNEMAGGAEADAVWAEERERCIREMRRHVPIPLSNAPEDLEKTARIEKYVDKVVARFGTTPTWPAADVGTPGRKGGPAFQARVRPWLLECFGEMIAGDKEERSHRFLEEALELVQACGATADEAHQLVDYVFGREVGDRRQEIGGVMVTLAALCLAWSDDMHDAGEDELARIWTKVEKIRAKQAAKPRFGPQPGVYPDRALADAPTTSEDQVTEGIG